MKSKAQLQYEASAEVERLHSISARRRFKALIASLPHCTGATVKDPNELEARHQKRLAVERKQIIDAIEDALDAKYQGIGKPISFSVENEMHVPELLLPILKPYVDAGWEVKHERCGDQRDHASYTSFTFTFHGGKHA